MAQVLFLTGTKAQYDALATKNTNAIYFLTDTGEIRKGDAPFSHPVKAVESFPESGEAGAIYVNTSTHEARLWDGTAWQTAGLPTVTSIGASDLDVRADNGVVSISLSEAERAATDERTISLSRFTPSIL